MWAAIGIASDPVGGADRVIEIAQQAERELLRLGEGKVLGGGVERRPEDGCADLVESCGPVTQLLVSFGREGACRSTQRPGW